TPEVVLLPPPAQHNAEGDTVSLALTAEDAQGGTLTYSATGLPSGLNIDSSTGVIAGDVASTASANSPYSVTVSAAHGSFQSSQTFTWAVSHVLLVNPG